MSLAQNFAIAIVAISATNCLFSALGTQHFQHLTEVAAAVPRVVATADPFTSGGKCEIYPQLDSLSPLSYPNN
jgi:hypothetical protein